MSPIPHPLPKIAGFALLVLLIAAVGGCGSTSTQTGSEPPLEAAEQTAEEAGFDFDLPPTELRAEFNAVESSLSSFDWMGASTQLDTLQEYLASAEDHAYADYLRARATFLSGDSENALSLLLQARELSDTEGLEYRVNTFEHFVRAIGGDHVGAARIATAMLPELPPDHAAAWKRSAWVDLQRAKPADIAAELATASDPDWMAWLQLAADSAGGDGSAGSVMRWLNQYPEHPAANPLPGGMSAEIETAASGGAVALLLPLSGRLAPAGKAVLDGYLAAHYARAAVGGLSRELFVIDTKQYPSANAAYDDAVLRGATLVIGPLDKNGVSELATRLERPVPVLALNRIDQVLPATGGALVQMSLSPEDEAITLAEAAFGQGARTALIIRPAGPWGDKVERALRGRWEQLGGSIVGGGNYGDREEQSASVKAALGLDSSEQRAQRVRDMLATNVEFIPRRRDDADVIFLLSRNSTQGRSIKPLLAFHYAANIPVYALSSIHSGRIEEGNRDLNGTNLVEIPWLLGAWPELRVAIATGDTGSDGYTRLNALGADAHLVQSGFARLQSGPDALYRGATGLLTMDASLRIKRQASLAVFDGERVVPR